MLERKKEKTYSMLNIQHLILFQIMPKNALNILKVYNIFYIFRIFVSLKENSNKCLIPKKTELNFIRTSEMLTLSLQLDYFDSFKT